MLAEAGHDSVHTSQLPEGNRISDATLADLADDEDRVVITKDRDFRNSHLLRRSPRRLLTVSTGNVANTELLALFAENLDTVVDALSEADYVELGPSGLIVHGDRDLNAVRLVADDAAASFDDQRLPPELSGVKFRRGKPLGAEQELLAGSPAGRTSTITTPPEVLVSRAGDLTP